MSRQHWIDEFFRKRMERRKFPLEEGEYEEVRALLQKRNSTGSAVRGGFSKWWLSALIPVAGLLWWAFEGELGEAEVYHALIGEHQPTTGRNDLQQDAKWSANTNPQAGADPMIGTAGRGIAVEAAMAPVQGADTVSQAERHVRGDHAAASRQSGSGDVMGTRDEASVNAQESDHNEAAPSLRIAGGPEQADMNTHSGGPDHSTVAELRDVPADQAYMDAVALMLPRWSLPRIADAPQPVQLEMPVFKRLATGELHFFGAPLTVRTQSSGGHSSGVEAGSLFGLEYRVRAKRLSWATGIHYGSYALRNDQGTTDVSLNFVEVPLLAGYGLGLGRFGLLLQGGMSVDFLFNSKGRYPVEVDRTSAGFQDDAFRTVNVSWLLRPQVTYQCSEHIGVSMGPLWKARLGEVAKEGPLDGARVSSSGLSFGLTWRLERTTF